MSVETPVDLFDLLWGHITVQDILKADIYKKDRSENTILHYLADNGEELLVKFLLELDSRLMWEIDDDGWTALHNAVENNEIAIAKLLKETKWIANKNGNRPFRFAMPLNECFKFLLEDKWIPSYETSLYWEGVKIKTMIDNRRTKETLFESIFPLAILTL